MEAVSKCLNHSSTVVTEKFYLRESAAEVHARCVTPWAQPETASEKQERALNALPSFLKQNGTGSASSGTLGNAVADERKRQRKEKNRALLREFNAR